MQLRKSDDAKLSFRLGAIQIGVVSFCARRFWSYAERVAATHTNRLANEKSPYLLQHAHNPVDWFAWRDEAFSRARAENKPIFLSIGYSTCHWCHVMERETFENGKVADFLRDHFISIKVDREERPDVDKIYMLFAQATTGAGGWPLNVFLTPDLKPFFAGTYFPPEQRHGRSGFLQVLQQISALWKERQGDVIASAEEIHARIQSANSASNSPGDLPAADVLQNAGRRFKESYDSRNGGFGTAPKFPQPSHPAFLLRYARRFADREAVDMVLHTCRSMAAGGIHDQLGGGFARYSVDAKWLVPHFEKMLYDNAQLTQLYLDAFLISGDSTHATVARDILDYTLRDMCDGDGGFFSAEDADSEGHEGKFYCWTKDELSKLLTVEEFNVASRCFGITAEGNFIDHSHPHPLPGQNILSMVEQPWPDDLQVFAAAKAKMTEARNQRIRPHRDDKILASWNGLMLGAMARAGAVLGEPKYLAAAEKNFVFIRSHLWAQKERVLSHRWRDGDRYDVQLLESYSFLLAGVLDLYEATLAAAHLEFAIALAETMVSSFYDDINGGFWQSPPDTSNLISRLKDDYDGAEPAGNSVAVMSLLRLATITGRDDFGKPADATLRLFAQRLGNFPQAMPCMLQALDYRIEIPRKVVLAGAPELPAMQNLVRAAHSAYCPNKVLMGNTGPVEPFAASLPAANPPVAYICTGDACQPPTQDAVRVKELLG